MKSVLRIFLLFIPFLGNCQNLGTGKFGKISINSAPTPTERLYVNGTANIIGVLKLGDIVNVRDEINSKLSTATALSTYAPIDSPIFTGTSEFAGNVTIGDTHTLTVAGNLLYNSFPLANSTILGDNIGNMTWGKLTNDYISNTANIDGSKLGTGIVSTTELNRLDGITDNVQTQLNSKINTSTADNKYVALVGNQSITGTKSFSVIEATTANISNLNVNGSVTLPIFEPNTSVFLKQDGTTGTFESQNVIFQSDVENLTSSLAAKSSLAGNNTFSGVNAFTGNVGIGTTTPSENLSVAGNIRYGVGMIGSAFTNTSSWKHSIIGTTKFDGTNYITTSVGSNAISVISNDLTGIGFYTTGSTGNETLSTSPSLFESYQRMRISTNGNIGINTSTPNSSFILDVESTNKLFAPPRMTATQASAVTPVDGGMCYVTTTNGTFTSVGFWGYVSGTWKKLDN